MTVNGREAMWVNDPRGNDTCTIHLRTEVGFVMMTTTLNSEGLMAEKGRCDGVLKMAEAIEPEIGAGN